MRAVTGGAIRRIFEHATDPEEKVVGGFAVSAVKKSDGDYQAALVPFGETSNDAMKALAEHVIEMIEKEENKNG